MSTFIAPPNSTIPETSSRGGRRGRLPGGAPTPRARLQRARPARRRTSRSRHARSTARTSRHRSLRGSGRVLRHGNRPTCALESCAPDCSGSGRCIGRGGFHVDERPGGEGRRRSREVRLQAGAEARAATRSARSRWRSATSRRRPASSRCSSSGWRRSGAFLFWTWPVVALMQFIVALNFAELSSHFPVAGSVYQWTKYLAGRRIRVVHGLVLRDRRHPDGRLGGGDAPARTVPDAEHDVRLEPDGRLQRGGQPTRPSSRSSPLP